MILKKYFAWLFSTATLLVLGSIILPKGFAQIADWIGPVLGSGLRLEMHLAFLFLGPSLTYHPLLYTWVAAGVIGGFFARGIRRSIVAGTISVITLLIIMVGNAFLLVKETGFLGSRLGTSGLPGTNLPAINPAGFIFPPPPAGFSLIELLKAPMVGEGLQRLAGGSTVSPLAIVSLLARNLLVNIITYALAFTTSGFIFSKIFRKRSVKMDVGSRPIQPRPSTPLPPSKAVLVCLAFLALLLTSVLLLPLGSSQTYDQAQGSTQENLTLALDKDGSLRTLYFANVTSIPGIPVDNGRDELQGLAGAFFFALSPDLASEAEQSLPSSISAFSSLVSLLPQNGFMAVYHVADPSLGRARADVLASEFGQTFGSSLSFATAIPLKSSSNLQLPGGGVYIGLYLGDGQPREIGNKMLSAIQGHGVGGILTPDKIFVNQYGLVAGLVQPNPDSPTAKPISLIGLFADISPLGTFYGRGNFTLGLRDLFGKQGTIGAFGPAGFTHIELDFPSNSNITKYGPVSAAPPANGKLSLSLNATDAPVSDVFVSFNNVFPQHVKIERSLDPKPPFLRGTIVTEKVTVSNLGNETIHQVKISDARTFQAYRTLQLLSASYNVTLGDIPAGESREATVQFRVLGEGVYTLLPVEANYLDQGEILRRSGTRTSMESRFNVLEYSEDLVRATAPVSYIFLFLAVLPPLLETRKLFRRSRSKQ